MKNKRIYLVCGLLCLFSSLLVADEQLEPMIDGNYAPTWASLSQYGEAPEWYQNVKFGIWAHWGPQCEPESGDWYARHMYYPGHWQHDVHASKYGSPNIVGFKDICNIWQADQWNPEYLMELYKRAGAQYFVTLANHHDNMDLWDSTYQPWNSVNIGPKKDIVGEWARVARAQNMHFGVSVHASHAWTWYEGSQDFDGNLTEADGIGKWWEGLNPQDLYAQNHTRSEGSTDVGRIHSQWDWSNGASLPNRAYLDNFYNRTIDLINKHNPELLYFDDTALPFWQIDDVGLKVASHYYNKSIAENNGSNEAVILGKILTEDQKECMVWDVERGIPDRPQEKPWQTCTCIGQWHYQAGINYKSASTVIKMLIDIVSKNGNLLLSIPIRGNGTIDNAELAVLNDIATWMDIHKESIYNTRPWIVFGEGPTAEKANPLSAQGFNEGQNFTSEDIRYVSKGDTIYATAMGWPTNNQLILKTLGTACPKYLAIDKVELLGYGELTFTRNYNGLKVTLPSQKTSDIALVLKIQYTSENNIYTFESLTNLITEVESVIELAKENAGYNTGQYNADSIAALELILLEAKELTATTDNSLIEAAIDKLQAAFYCFSVNSFVAGGKLTFENVQNITTYMLTEARNFSRSDEGAIGTGRWGLLGEPWIVTNNIINQEGNSRGGYDDYDSGHSIGIQKWNASDAAIVNGMIYQTTNLPAGEYKLKIKVHEKYDIQVGEIYLNVNQGNILPISENVPTNSLAYYDISNCSTGGQYTVCDFTLEEETEVSIGWTVSIPEAATHRSMRVNELLLLDEYENDISANYLRNYRNIQRKDYSYSRFGTPADWMVDNFNIPQSNNDGIKLGIDRYPGYNTLMLGIWNDATLAQGTLNDARIYRQVTLPAGRYAFMAGYDALYQLSNMYMFASVDIPTCETLKDEALAFYSIVGGPEDGTMIGLEFTLEQETDVYLGWIGDLSQGSSTQEFRVTEIALLKVLSVNNDILYGTGFDASSNDNLTIPISQFATLKNLKWNMSMDNTSYIVGNFAGEISIGEIDFGTNNEKIAFVETANDGILPTNSVYHFYKGEDTQPFVSVAAKNTNGAILFETSESDIFQLGDVHNVTVKYSGHSSNLKSIGFKPSQPAGGIGDVQILKTKYYVYGSNELIIIDNLVGEDVSVYDVSGKLVHKSVSRFGKIAIPIKQGIYVVHINDFATKVVL